MNENKEEVAAFEHLHQAVVKWIDEGDHVLVRSKIGQIMDVWQQKQKVKKGTAIVSVVACELTDLSFRAFAIDDSPWRCN